MQFGAKIPKDVNGVVAFSCKFVIKAFPLISKLLWFLPGQISTPVKTSNEDRPIKLALVLDAVGKTVPFQEKLIKILLLTRVSNVPFTSWSSCTNGLLSAVSLFCQPTIPVNRMASYHMTSFPKTSACVVNSWTKSCINKAVVALVAVSSLINQPSKL